MELLRGRSATSHTDIWYEKLFQHFIDIEIDISIKTINWLALTINKFYDFLLSHVEKRDEWLFFFYYFDWQARLLKILNMDNLMKASLVKVKIDWDNPLSRC